MMNREKWARVEEALGVEAARLAQLVRLATTLGGLKAETREAVDAALFAAQIVSE